MLDKGHGMLGTFIEKTAGREGKPVLFFDPRNTSRKCARCHHVDAESRKSERFRCTACGHEDHACQWNAGVSLSMSFGDGLRRRTIAPVGRL